MTIKGILTAAGAVSLAMSSVAAAAANPAQSLSVTSSARASQARGDDKLAGAAGWLPVGILAIVAVVSIVLLTDGDDSDSN